IYLFLLYFTVSAQIPIPFKGADSLWSTFDDREQGGNSHTLKLQIEGEARWAFRLEDGATWPYVGLGYDVRSVLSEKKMQGKLSKTDSLIMHIHSNSSGRLTLQLAVFDPEVTRKDDPVSYRVLETPITVTTESERKAVPLNDFRVAEWWRQRYEVPPEDNRHFLDSICMVEWAISDTSRISNPDTLIISGLAFSLRSDKTVSAWTFTAVILLAAALTLLLALRRFRKHSTLLKQHNTLELQPKPVATGPSEWNRVMRFLESNYLCPDLNLKKAADQLGMSESRLSRLIRENYQGGFRPLIHDLRTEEGKRLLRETKLNVAEIAYKLGYATPNHFNREFKERTEISPTLFRKKSRTETSTSDETV
ncbi:MAG: helix-turn-helix domain-containing protein, partial [Chitinispirillaceae bacterium]